MDVAIRVRVSHASGLGHWVRQIHLARALAEQGLQVHLFPDSNPTLKARPAPDLNISPVSNDNEFLEQLPDALPLAILDIQDTSETQIETLRQKAHNVCGLEDLGRGRNRLDILIDCNLEKGTERDLPGTVQCLFGTDFSLLHPEYAKSAGRPRNFRNGVQSLLITLGGTDPNHLTRPVAETAHQVRPDLTITVLWGPGFEQERDRQALEENPAFTVHAPVDHLVRLLEDHDAVICAGGVTVHEALAAGTPAFVLAQVPHQADKAHALEKLGAAHYLGMAGNWSTERLTRALNSASDELSEMSARGRRIIDGKGLERIVQILTPLAQGRNN